MSAHPTVTAVITTYDRTEFLGDAVRSVLMQSIRTTEVIVVDDASPTDPAPVLTEFEDRVRLIRLDANSGANAARNAGVRAASGEWVAFLDDDDIWRPDKTEEQFAAMSDGDEAALCGLEQIDGKSPQICPVARVTEAHLRGGNPFCGMSGLIARRDVLLQEPLDETLPNGQDWDIYIRLARRRPLAYAAAPLFARRYGSHSGITLSAQSESVEALEKRTRVIEKHRDWLGETHYRRRLASYLLKYIGKRKNPVRFVLHAMRRAGASATVRHLARKALRRPEFTWPQGHNPL
ncbi:glycosyltransferase family 2 protein [Pontivivens ytuae]|uniref:Glycosyltransferase family 2 protein n=1 Tax=Pontivivens ytuae TaxID=2789856 RepID=A0A7S9LVJ9_9RHOB|nr:glycosyltransferase family A protein [Pontivivens ytuae]QPH56054.1 glycosyltransferase family 2 protein [Pontivivens ytuae]